MVIAVEHLSKAFPGTKALRDVSLEFPEGAVHALLGANGSGKSTLVKVLTGVYQPDQGSIRIGGRQMSGLASPADAVRLGVRVVHQEAPLLDTFSVAECIAVFHGYPTGPFARVRWPAVNRYAQGLLDRYQITVDPRTLCARLRPSERGMVSMAIALGLTPETAALLVLDEATAAVPEDEAEPYLETVKRVAHGGVPVLIVTHRVREVPAVADRVSVLADGEVVFSGAAPGLDEERLVSYMAPSKATRSAELAPEDALAEGLSESTARPLSRLWIDEPARRSASVSSEPPLVVEGLSAAILKDVSFVVGKGEIVGAAGLPDSGIGELPLIVAGALPRVSGRIVVNGHRLRPDASPREAIHAGLGLVPADRLHQGAVQTLSIRENLVLPQVARFWRRSSAEKECVTRAIETLEIRPPLPSALLARLSGGNQQKVVIGKWLLMRPDLLVLDDPTYGVDPSSRQHLLRILREAAGEGLGILFLSTEPEQLVQVCSRILVFRKGSLAKVLQDAEMTRENVARWSSL